MRLRRDDGGFTLIELLVVIVILGVLAGIVVFAVGAIRGEGAASACAADRHTISTAIEAYRAQHSVPPLALTDLVSDHYLHDDPTISADAKTTSDYTLTYDSSAGALADCPTALAAGGTGGGTTGGTTGGGTTTGGTTTGGTTTGGTTTGGTTTGGTTTGGTTTGGSPPDTTGPALTITGCTTTGATFTCTGTLGTAPGDQAGLTATVKQKASGTPFSNGGFDATTGDSWSYSGQPLTKGVTMVFTISQSDAAGNVTTRSTEFTRPG